jgi:phosphohistidine phosphatase SixA
MTCRILWVSVLASMLFATFQGALAQTQTAPASAIAANLKKGGYVLVVRHARSPREAPDERTANKDNTERERQLDEVGREDAAAMGKAMRALGIPVGTVLPSPTYRARETIRYAQWPGAKDVPELGDRGRSMQGVTEVEGAWLQKRVTELPRGTNTILVTHLPNITRAFPDAAKGVEDGDTLVFGPNGQSGVALVGRIKIGEWPTLR